MESFAVVTPRCLSEPQPLVDVTTIRTREDWIAAGERAFRELDHYWSRTSDPH